MKLQIFSGTKNPISNTYVLDTDGTTPLALAVNTFLATVTPITILQSQSSATVPPVISTTGSSTVYSATPAVVPPIVNLTISIFY